MMYKIIGNPKYLPDDEREEPVQKKKDKSKFTLLYWSKEEHQRFLVGLQLFGLNWSMVQPLVRTRSSKQIISHY